MRALSRYGAAAVVAVAQREGMTHNSAASVTLRIERVEHCIRLRGVASVLHRKCFGVLAWLFPRHVSYYGQSINTTWKEQPSRKLLRRVTKVYV